MSGLSVEVDLDVCCRAGRCAATEPRVFDQGPDGAVILLDPAPPADLHETVLLCAELCPCEAITVIRS